MAIIKKLKHVSWDVEELGPLCIAGRNLNSLAILQNVKCIVTICLEELKIC